MATEVVMPKLGMTMVEGTLASWLVPDGAAVEPGMPIFRMTTEKIDYEVEAETPGVLRHAAAEEAVIEAGGLVAYILAPGEAAPAGLGAVTVSAATPAKPAADGAVAPAPRQAGEFVRATPAARRLARELGVDLGVTHGSGPDGQVTERDVQAQAAAARRSPAAAASPVTAAADGEVKASPLAKRLAEQHGIDLHALRGSGPGGRIVQEDVEQAVAARAAAPAAAAPAPVAASGGATPVGSVAYRGMRRTIGERMRQSLQEMAQLTMATDADVTDLVKLRGQLVEEWQSAGARVSYTDLIIKAAAKALRDHPRVNASLEGDAIALHADVHIGMAVALAEGLIVPVIRDADRKPLKQLALETGQLAEKARTGKLGFDEVTGGTFSVTSLGMYSVDVFTPIINPPQAAILGVGRIREGIALNGSEVVRRSLLTLSLTIDHRILDGAPAAEFLARIRQLLERPYLLLAEGA